MEITPSSRGVNACLTATNLEKCKSDLYLAFAKKAWRRPLTDDEKASLATMWKSVIAAGGSDKDAYQAIIQAVTLSAKFLFRAVNPLQAGSKSVAAIDDYSLASRLSFFLWSSIPDEELLAATDRQELRDPTRLGAQLKGMLADPKSTRFVNGFASQWIYTRLLNQAHPDVTVFGDFDFDLRAAFTLESQLVFGDFLTNGKPISDLLSPGFTFANDRLAKHYGLNVPGSAIPKKVPVADNVRGGVLTHGAWLTVASLPSDTMPVKRGAWIMENILCQTVPPPPAVSPLDLGAVGTAKMTVRERFVKHLTNSSCASCHNLIDPCSDRLEVGKNDAACTHELRLVWQGAGAAGGGVGETVKFVQRLDGDFSGLSAPTPLPSVTDTLYPEFASIFGYDGNRSTPENAAIKVKNSFSIENPNAHDATTLDCASCHTADTERRAAVEAVPTLSVVSKAAFKSTTWNLTATQPDFDHSSLQMFSFFGNGFRIALRTINESAFVADQINAKE
ncbi:MAG: DUF1592 domain-containing protein [Chitinophagaceae bacterium]|nr:DUF1592 domain-containing protein [Oligoflexus sp.]